MNKKLILFFIFILLTNFSYAILSDGTVYYTFDNTLNDEIGTNHLTNNGATYTASGHINGAYTYDGSNDYMRPTTDTVFEDTAFTINLWGAYDQPDNFFMDNSYYDGSTNYYGYYLQLRSTNTLEFLLYTGSTTTNFRARTSTTVSAGSSYRMYTFVYDGTTPKVYINAVEASYDIQTTGTMGYSTGNHPYSIGEFTRSATRFWDGEIDEYGHWDRALSQSEITSLYNSGTGLQYPFGESGGAEIEMNLSYPENGTHYNVFTGVLNLSISNANTCQVNHENFTYTSNTSTDWLFSNTTALTDGNYSININCSNEDENFNNITFNFYIDTVNPIITVNTPSNNSVFDYQVTVDVDFEDTNLYRANLTIYNSSDDIIENKYFGDLNIDTYNISFTKSLDPDTYRMEMWATDDHTVNFFNEELDYVISENDKNTMLNDKNTMLKYKMKHGEIEFKYPNDVNINTIVSEDRWRQKFTYDNLNIEEIEIEIEADNIVYRDMSEYNCHLILNNYYWYDCEGLNNAEIIEVNNNKVKFKFLRSEVIDLSESIGGLNIVGLNSTFTMVGNVKPNVTINFPINQTTVNGIININWLIEDFNNDNTLTNVTLNNSIIESNLPSTNTSILFNTNNFTDGTYYLNITTQENETIEKFKSSSVITIIINNNITTVSLNCIDCLNTTINCSWGWNENSTAYKICQDEVDEMYIAFALFIMMTFGGFIALGYYINNIKINLENLSAEEQAQGLWKIKSDMIVKAIGIFSALIMLLIMVGFTYVIGNSLNVLFGKFLMIYWVMCVAGIFLIFILMVYKMFTFPFKVVGEFFNEQERHHRR